MDRAELGAQLVTYGITSFFKPWFFDGKTVNWGQVEETESEALESAKRLKALLT